PPGKCLLHSEGLRGAGADSNTSGWTPACAGVAIGRGKLKTEGASGEPQKLASLPTLRSSLHRPRARPEDLQCRRIANETRLLLRPAWIADGRVKPGHDDGERGDPGSN